MGLPLARCTIFGASEGNRDNGEHLEVEARQTVKRH